MLVWPLVMAASRSASSASALPLFDATAEAGVGAMSMTSPLRGTPLNCSVKPLMSVGGSGIDAPPCHTAVPVFSNTGDYTWELFDASNTLLNTGTAVWQGGASIPEPPTDINGFTLQLSGVPRSGDVVDGMRIDFSSAPAAGDRFLL